MGYKSWYGLVSAGVFFLKDFYCKIFVIYILLVLFLGDIIIIVIIIIIITITITIIRIIKSMSIMWIK